jgi:hypothetical protein
MFKTLLGFIVLVALLAIALFAVEAQIINQPPPLPPMQVQPTGNLTVGWDYDTNLFAPTTFSGTNIVNGTSFTYTNQCIFTVYFSRDFTNWVRIVTVTNALSAPINIAPAGSGFITVTASNFWGESFFAQPLSLPPLPVPGINLTVKRGWAN